MSRLCNLLLCIILLSSYHAGAQHYVRTKKNIGILASAYIPDYALHKGTNHGAVQGTGFAVGITKEFRSFLYPELFFASHQTQAFVPGSGTIWGPSSVTSNAIGVGITLKKDLLNFDMRKKRGNCFGRVLYFFLGPEYVYPIGGTLPQGVSQQGEFAAKAGLGMYSIWGGSSKSHSAWTIHWEFYYRRSFTPFLKTDFGTQGNDQYLFSSFGITLRVIHFRTYKFSEM
ncbi:MAG TPA: hypothetical protein VNZ86_15750 [Bacteroidia bacterium]|jgi:hypothetical protein|nr:hypothetical protein [Bacteroidia bacterium]